MQIFIKEINNILLNLVPQNYLQSKMDKMLFQKKSYPIKIGLR